MAERAGLLKSDRHRALLLAGYVTLDMSRSHHLAYSELQTVSLGITTQTSETHWQMEKISVKLQSCIWHMEVSRSAKTILVGRQR